jgi:hypothetical protein
MSMDSRMLECFLARLYSEPDLVSSLISGAPEVLEGSGLSSAAKAEIYKMDWIGLQMAAYSYERKRSRKCNEKDGTSR